VPHTGSLVLGSGSVRREKIAAKKPTLVGSDREKTFGPTITGLIHRHIGPLAERLRLWDSKLRVRGGRPDTMKILKEVYHACQWGRAPKVSDAVYSRCGRALTRVTPVCSAVVFTGYGGNSEIMQGCKEAAGIPAWHSVRGGIL
jgi:hypothetical protein